MRCQIDYKQYPSDNFEMKSSLAIFALTVHFFYASAFDHGKVGPSMSARNNGQVVSSEEVGAHFEMVAGKKNFKIYVYTMDLKPFDFADYKLSAAGFRVTAGKGFYELSPGHRKGIKIFLTVVNAKTQKKDILRFIF